MGIGQLSQCTPCEGYIGTASGDLWDTCINSFKFTFRQIHGAKGVYLVKVNLLRDGKD